MASDTSRRMVDLNSRLMRSPLEPHPAEGLGERRLTPPPVDMSEPEAYVPPPVAGYERDTLPPLPAPDPVRVRRMAVTPNPTPMDEVPGDPMAPVSPHHFGTPDLMP